MLMMTQNAKILIIDDTPINLITLGKALQDEFNLQFATSGPEGIELALKAPPDLILLDIMMPKVDGYETFSRILAHPVLKDIPVIFITAINQTDSEVAGLKLGAADFITKPIRIDVARQRISNLLEREYLRRELRSKHHELVVEVERQRQSEIELQQLTASLNLVLKEKVALIKEVHHRVYNNLQVISSLMRLESEKCKHTETRSVLDELQGRVRCMGVLHGSLSNSGSSASIDLGRYIEEIASQAFQAQSTLTGIVRLDLQLTSVQVGMDQAVTCGLLVNELISNSLKHGFAEKNRGVIRVELDQPDNNAPLMLRVGDTGGGLSADFQEKREHSLGLQLVDDLVAQIGGLLTIDSTPGQGTCFTVNFNINKPSPMVME